MPILGSQGRSSRGTHIPEKSGLPPEVFGAGARRFGLPSGVRGVPGVGKLIH
jgi:hypothetical protein